MVNSRLFPCLATQLQKSSVQPCLHFESLIDRQEALSVRIPQHRWGQVLKGCRLAFGVSSSTFAGECSSGISWVRIGLQLQEDGPLRRCCILRKGRGSGEPSGIISAGMVCWIHDFPSWLFEKLGHCPRFHDTHWRCFQYSCRTRSWATELCFRRWLVICGTRFITRGRTTSICRTGITESQVIPQRKTCFLPKWKTMLTCLGGKEESCVGCIARMGTGSTEHGRLV